MSRESIRGTVIWWMWAMNKKPLILFMSYWSDSLCQMRLDWQTSHRIRWFQAISVQITQRSYMHFWIRDRLSTGVRALKNRQLKQWKLWMTNLRQYLPFSYPLIDYGHFAHLWLVSVLLLYASHLWWHCDLRICYHPAKQVRSNLPIVCGPHMT